MPATARTISGFSAAVTTAVALHHLYGRFAAVALLDELDNLIDMTPFSGDDACVMCAVEWAHARSHADRRVRRAIVLSGTSELSADLREDDVRLYHAARGQLEAIDLEVLDWLQTDGDQVRSLTFSCDVTPAWGEEAPADEAPG